MVSEFIWLQCVFSIFSHHVWLWSFFSERFTRQNFKKHTDKQRKNEEENEAVHLELKVNKTTFRQESSGNY